MTSVVARVAGRISSLDRPALVAIDGADGAGKTTFADALGEWLVATGHQVVRATVDDFHHPQSRRHALGRTAETVWSRSFDTLAIRRELLDPWRRGPGSAYRRRWHDLATDAYVDEPAEPVPELGVLLVDGVFVQRPELADVWHFVVWLEAPDEIRVARMAVRDGTVGDVNDPDQQRYLGAQRIYLETCDPAARADVVIGNSDGEHPILLRG